jgi:ribonuclease J
MYSLQNVLDLAIETNRPVITYGRVYSNFLRILKTFNPKMKLPRIIDYRKANEVKNSVILITGTRERLYQRLVRISHNEDIFLKIKEKDLIIMACPPINGLEGVYQTITDIVAKKSPNVFDVESGDFYMPNPAKEDIKETIKALQPKYFLPISALYRYLIVAAREANNAGLRKDKIISLQNGKVAYFIDGAIASQSKKITNVNDVIIDGFGIGDISYEVIREREMLSKDGALSIVIPIDRVTKKIKNKVALNFVGIAINDAEDDLRQAIINKVHEIVDEEQK